MATPLIEFEFRPMRVNEWEQVAGLIYESTNFWYINHGKNPIFTGPKSDTLLFCEVYESLDQDVVFLQFAKRVEPLQVPAFTTLDPPISHSEL